MLKCVLKDLSVAEFVERFERPRLPVVITGLTDEWAAGRGAWSVESLLKRFGSHRFKVGAIRKGMQANRKGTWLLRMLNHRNSQALKIKVALLLKIAFPVSAGVIFSVIFSVILISQ